MALMLLAAGPLTNCSGGETSTEDLCKEYDDLSAQLLEGNGIIGNPLFNAVGRLGRLAERHDDPDVAANGRVLSALADSDEIIGRQLDDATGAIAEVCDRPSLTLNGILGTPTTVVPTRRPTASETPTSAQPHQATTVTESASVDVDGEPLPSSEDADDDAGVGLPGPVLSGKSIDGSRVTTPQAGKATLLVFVSHWSPHAQAAVDMLGEWVLGAESINVVVVSSGVQRDQVNYPPSVWLRDISEHVTVLVDSQEESPVCQGEVRHRV